MASRKIIETSGPVSFRVLLEDGRYKHCHQDHLRSRVVDDGPPEMSQISVDDSIPFSLPSSDRTSNEIIPEVTEEEQRSVPPEPPDRLQSTERTNSDSSRYPRRQRKPREWFEPGRN